MKLLLIRYYEKNLRGSKLSIVTYILYVCIMHKYILKPNKENNCLLYKMYIEYRYIIHNISSIIVLIAYLL